VEVTASHDTNMLPKIGLIKQFVKFEISNNFKQNIDETSSKQPIIHRKIHASLRILKILRKNPRTKKASRFLPDLCDFQ
jgi:hypothetical protein